MSNRATPQGQGRPHNIYHGLQTSPPAQSSAQQHNDRAAQFNTLMAMIDAQSIGINKDQLGALLTQLQSHSQLFPGLLPPTNPLASLLPLPPPLPAPNLPLQSPQPSILAASNHHFDARNSQNQTRDGPGSNYLTGPKNLDPTPSISQGLNNLAGSVRQQWPAFSQSWMNTKTSQTPGATFAPHFSQAPQINSSVTDHPNTEHGSPRDSRPYGAMAGSLDRNSFQEPQAPVASVNTHQSQADTNSKRNKAARFISLLYKNGVGYEDLVAEGLDSQHLKQMFEELGLDISINNARTLQGSQPGVAQTRSVQKVSQDVTLAPSSSEQLAKIPLIDKAQVSTASSVKPAIKNTASNPSATNVTRQAYLEKLRAAASLKQSNLSSQEQSDRASSPPASAKASKTPVPTIQTDQIPSNTPSSVTVGLPSLAENAEVNQRAQTQNVPSARKFGSALLAAEAEAKRRAQTELARKRMEALTAERAAASQLREATANASVPVTTNPRIGHSQVSQAVPVSSDEYSTPTSRESSPLEPKPTFAHQFPVHSALPSAAGQIPGLFIPSQQTGSFSAVSGNSMQASPVGSPSRKRPIPSTPSDDGVERDFSSLKRPFIPAKTSEHEDRCIIEVSDNDESDNAMDLDDEYEEGGAFGGSPSRQVSHAQPPKSFISRIPSFPSPHTKISATRSGTGTPVIHTPASYSGDELRKKEAAIALMRQRIREREAKQKRTAVTSDDETKQSDAVITIIQQESNSRQPEATNENVSSPTDLSQPLGFDPSSSQGSAASLGLRQSVPRETGEKVSSSERDTLEQRPSVSIAKDPKSEQSKLTLSEENQAPRIEAKSLSDEMVSFPVDAAEESFVHGSPVEKAETANLSKSETQISQINFTDTASDGHITTLHDVEAVQALAPPVHVIAGNQVLATLDRSTVRIPGLNFSPSLNQDSMPPHYLDSMPTNPTSAVLSRARFSEADTATLGLSSSIPQGSIDDDDADDAMDFEYDYEEGPEGTAVGPESATGQPSEAMVSSGQAIVSPFSAIFSTPSPVEVADGKAASADGPIATENTLADVSMENSLEDGELDGDVEGNAQATQNELMHDGSDRNGGNPGEELEEGEWNASAEFSPLSSSESSSDSGSDVDSEEDESTGNHQTLRSTLEPSHAVPHEGGMSFRHNETPVLSSSSNLVMNPSDPSSLIELKTQAPRKQPDEPATGSDNLHSGYSTSEQAKLPLDPSKRGLFRPYESPLKMFKAYRFHPDYSSTVRGGFRSLTYSNNIDANKLICQFEVAGGICNDPDCSQQHFRSMKLTDDKIIVQIGTLNHTRLPDEKKRWVDGLRAVLKDLRKVPNIRDPDVGAAAVAKYRRDFLRDPSRILDY